MLEIRDLHVTTDEKEIVSGVSLEIGKGLYFLMGPNGAGKSTLARALAGDPSLKVSGSMALDGEDITSLEPEERFKRGLFLGYQIPPEIKGVKVRTFLEKSLKKVNRKLDLEQLARQVGLPVGILERDVNLGFSGGERKKLETMQMLAFKPRYAILDEPDSGIDIDTIRKLGEILESCKKECGILVITHTGNLLKFTKPDKVFILADGKIVARGDHGLVEEIEERGYSWAME